MRQFGGGGGVRDRGGKSWVMMLATDDSGTGLKVTFIIIFRTDPTNPLW